MRFMLLMIPLAYQPDAPPQRRAQEGFVPPTEAMIRMIQFNQEMAEAGVLTALDALHPGFEGVRVAFAGGEPMVKHNEFTDLKEVVGGFWIIEVNSMEEAIEWAKRCPASEGDVVEVRQLFEPEEFSPELQTAAEKTLAPF